MRKEHHQIKSYSHLRENMNIDQRERKDAPLVWAIIIICMVAFGYLAVFDKRFDVLHEVKKWPTHQR